MNHVRMKFSVPEGEELTSERLAALSELGIEGHDVRTAAPGTLWIRCRSISIALGECSDEDAECLAEEIMEATGDMELRKIIYPGDAG